MPEQEVNKRQLGRQLRGLSVSLFHDVRARDVVASLTASD
jgi:hypothetical protein